MGEMQEIVSAAAVGKLFALLAIVLPIAGAAIGGALGARRHNIRRGLLLGCGCGLAGPVNWLMWQIYNAITARNGLDTVRNFLLNLAVFVIIGILIGLILGRLGRTFDLSSETAPTQEEDQSGQ